MKFNLNHGLSNEEVKIRLTQYGKNILPEKQPLSSIYIFISQFKNPLVYVLLAAGVTSIVFQHLADASLILLALTINSIFGFAQEQKATKALEALKKYLNHHAEVVRNGKREKINVTDIVPGDIVFLHHGSKVPADGDLVFANRLYIDEAVLTGESIAIGKKEDDLIFMGTTVASGQGVMKVISTAKQTRIGQIALELSEIKEETPLKKQLRKFSQNLVYLILLLISFVFILGAIRGEDMVEMFQVAVSLAVSSIPEGLLVSMTVVLAIGMQRILGRRGLVKKLTSAETLGGVTTICIDKTGTLTEGKMRVTDFIGEKAELARQIVFANDLDDPLVIEGFNWGKPFVKDEANKHEQLDSIPFSPKERFFVSLNKWNEKNNVIFVNGAPDTLLNACQIDAKTKLQIEKSIEDLTTQGKRILGFARKLVPVSQNKLQINQVKNDLVWVGILAFTDPVRQGVREALLETKKAGIKLIVITGDYPKTSEFVLTELGIHLQKDEIILGDDLNNLSIEELSKKVKSVKLFARTTPDQKLKIVAALKKNGEVVAMMGDGVNDAPALHESDIGVVVAEASDVAREEADLVLLDSNFSTVVAAIEEGRGIFDNIRKIILYLMSDAFGGIVVVVGSMLLNLPLPITAVQILWINLISDGFPFFALTVDPKRADIMKVKPRERGEQLINRWMLNLMGTISLISGLFALLFFVYILRQTGDLVLARSIVFIVLGVNSLIYVFSTRTLFVPFWKTNLFENHWLVIAVLAGFCLQLLPFANSTLMELFSVKAPELIYWIVALFLSVSLFFIVEVFKSFNSVLK